MAVYVTGKTFTIRDRLRDLGGRWNADSKSWEFYTLSDAHRRELTATVGVMINDAPGEPIPPAQPPRRAPEAPRKVVPRPQRQSLEDFVAETLERKDPRTTNIFGDDPTWFNYFADQNPTSYFGFSSLSALVKCVETIPARIINDDTDDRNSAWERGRFDWYASECMPDAIDIARNGWAEGVELAQEVHEKLIGRHATERRRKHSVSGGSVNVGRLLAGNPDHMRSRPKQPGKKVITFFTESAFSASINSEHVIIRAATIAAIVDILEMNGFSCEIVATANTRHAYRPSWQIVTTLKSAGEPLNLNDIVFALGHTSYFRRLNLGLIALDAALSNVWETGSYPSDAFNDRHTMRANEIYIKRIDHDDRKKIDDTAPLITKAMQIWDLITDGNLPVTLNRKDAA